MRVHRVAILVSGVAASLIVAGELRAARYLNDYAANLGKDAIDDEQHIAQYRRPLPTGVTLDQNAAVWYRLAFARTPRLPHEATRRLDSVVQAGAQAEPSRLREALRAHCAESHSTRVQNALACAQCNWGLAYRVTNDAAYDSVSQAVTLAHCLILQGYEHELERDLGGAAQRYLDALSFSCDLGIGDFEMDFAGLMFARNALTALGQVVVSVEHDRRLLADIGEKLAKFEHSLPVEHHGIHVERLRLAYDLLDEADTYVTTRPFLIGYVMPRRTVAAWRLSRSEAVLSELLRAIAEKAPERRAQLALEANATAAEGRNAIVSQEIRSHWYGYLVAADEVLCLYRAVQSAITLQEWRIQHRRYPAVADVTSLALQSYGLRYAPTEDGHRYTLYATDNEETPRTVLETRPNVHLPSR